MQFPAVNVQIVNGTGKTASVNGTGNLVIGYDETPGTQSGSHNLVLGTSQTYTSYDHLAGTTTPTPVIRLRCWVRTTPPLRPMPTLPAAA